MKPTLYYIHDPMCSWCWGFTQTLNELLENLPDGIEIKRLLGGLAPDSNIAMPQSMQQQIKSNWSRIEDTISGVKFNYDFWINNVPRRATYPACRAVLAARKQDNKYDVLMTKAIQRAYYQEARNPSDVATLVELAQELNISVTQFKNDLASDEVNDELHKEINFSRELYAESYPSLVLVSGDKSYTVRINYNDSNIMLKKINEIIQSK